MTEPKPDYKVKALPRCCRNCASYETFADRPGGRCHKHAPRPYVILHGISDFDKTLCAYWPFVQEYDWCSEYSEKK